MIQKEEPRNTSDCPKLHPPLSLGFARGWARIELSSVVVDVGGSITRVAATFREPLLGICGRTHRELLLVPKRIMDRFPQHFPALPFETDQNGEANETAAADG